MVKVWLKHFLWQLDYAMARRKYWTKDGKWKL